MEELNVATILLDLALILFSTKVMGMLMRKLGLPQVVGALIAGILIGPAIWGDFFGWAPIMPNFIESNFLKGMAGVGVVLILFSAGMDTDVQELKRSGLVSTLIAFAGVLVPLGLGFLVAVPFMGGFEALGEDNHLLSCLFIGVILTATSVGITVETLKELGKLNGKIGTTILSAAIIDDVIGIVVLSVVIGMKDASVNPWVTLGMTVAFFVAAIAFGLLFKKFFHWLANKYPHTRRVPIFSLVLCFFYAFAAERWFGIADITGAYIAGIVLSGSKEMKYIDTKIGTNSYMIFSPVFFANIGINTNFTQFNLDILWFGLAFVAVGILGKIIGCGGVAKLCKFNLKDSAKIGVGMIARGEVALVVANKGIANGLLPSVYMTPVIMLIVISSLIAPIVLKILFRSDSNNFHAPDEKSVQESVQSID